MFRRAGIDSTAAASLDDLLEPQPAGMECRGSVDGARPVFHVRLFGYDRLEVDNYVARTEWEVRSARRHADHLLDRFGACSAELEISRRASARTERDQQPGPVTERIAEVLRLAAAEAAHMVDAAAEEADRLLAEARLEADARLCKVQAITETAVARGEELLRGARAARDRLEAEAAAAQDRTQAALARLAVVEEELVDLHRQRDEARSSLRRLTDQVGQALQAVDPEDPVGPRRAEPGVLTTVP
jgi:chromosome segregation ATPase